MKDVFKQSMFNLKNHLNALPELKQAGIELQHTAVLNAMAAALGYQNIQALCAFLEDPSSSCKFCPHCGAVGTLSEGAGVFIEAGEYDGDQYDFEQSANCMVCSRCSEGFIDCFVDSETIDGPRYELYSYETEHEYLKKDASYLCDIGNVEEARALLEASPELKSHVAIVMRNARDYREQEVFIYGPTLSQA